MTCFSASARVCPSARFATRHPHAHSNRSHCRLLPVWGLRRAVGSRRSSRQLRESTPRERTQGDSLRFDNAFPFFGACLGHLRSESQVGHLGPKRF